MIPISLSSSSAHLSQYCLNESDSENFFKICDMTLTSPSLTLDVPSIISGEFTSIQITWLFADKASPQIKSSIWMPWYLENGFDISGSFTPKSIGSMSPHISPLAESLSSFSS